MYLRTLNSKFQILILVGVAVFAGCNLIDEDTSECEQDFSMNLSTRLITNLNTSLGELSLVEEAPVQNALRAHLSGIFPDIAHDMDYRFYQTHGDSLLAYSRTEVIDADKDRMEIHLPVLEYQHLSIANLMENGVVSLKEDDRCRRNRLVQPSSDVIPSHKTGIFSGRLLMELLPQKDQTFTEELYMVNCASALVLDTLSSHIKGASIYVTDMATDFSVCDSLYHYGTAPLVRADKVDVNEGSLMCFAAVHMPSKDNGRRTKLVVEDPTLIDSEESAETWWRLKCYLTLKDDTVTETVLGVRKPIRAGSLMVLRASADNTGRVIPQSAVMAGVSVQIDWNDGGSHVIDL